VARRAKILRKATKLRKGMSKLGLTFLLETNEMCSVLTTVNMPEGLDIDELRNNLREQSIIIYEGKGPFKGLVFQVGSIGELSKPDVQTFLRALRGAVRGMQIVPPLRAEKAELSLPDLFESDVFEEVPIGASALRDGAA
jgi:2-aminoethylphosphonate-pyruvate transaminase